VGNGTRYAVASAHPLSTSAGLEVLNAGGNAFDAALAVSATLPVVQPHMNGLGSDFFAVVREDRSWAINSSGPSGHEATPRVFQELGLASIPARGPLSAITVPGLVAAGPLLAERGHLRWKEVLAPAVRCASRGYVPSASLVRAARATAWADGDLRATFAPARKGMVLRLPSIAKTLRQIAEDEGHGFYHGALAQAICRDLARKGGLLDASDFADFRPSVGSPLSVRYREYKVETNPPPSQGATELIWLNLLSRADVSSMGETRFVRTLVRTMRTAYRFRARYIGDPAFVNFPKQLLRPAADYRLAAHALPPAAGRSDTTAFSVYDGKVGISAIQSNYMGFGSGVAIHGTGITLNNRGSYFTLDEAHPNVLAPRKRTFHTLMATVASGPRLLLLGSMGGDVQPQVNVQVLSRHLDRDEPLQEAVTAARFAYPASIYGSATLYREPGLALPGSRVVRNDPASFGHAQGISVGDEIEVGIDPRGDGLLPLPS
jgi:gamma-glutamyltranspeptidase / glutathione hydrolase